MSIIEELSKYFGTEASTLHEFEADFKDVYYSHDYVETLFRFLSHIDRKGRVEHEEN